MNELSMFQSLASHAFQLFESYKQARKKTFKMRDLVTLAH